MATVSDVISRFQKSYRVMIITVLAVVVVSIYFHIIINITPSMKLGFYRKTNGEIRHGDIIAFCLPEPTKTLGLSRLYIEKGRACDGSDPLIKEVIAIPGDRVVLQDEFVEVNDQRFPYRTIYNDSEGRALSVYPRGEYPNTEGYWLIGTHAHHSWDSRYWGAVKKDQILSKLRPLWTW